MFPREANLNCAASRRDIVKTARRFNAGNQTALQRVPKGRQTISLCLCRLQGGGEHFSLSLEERAGVRILPNRISRFEPLNRSAEHCSASRLRKGHAEQCSALRRTRFMGRTVVPTNLFCVLVRPHPDLLPQEKEWQTRVFGLANDLPVNPVWHIQKDEKRFYSPLARWNLCAFAWMDCRS